MVFKTPTVILILSLFLVGCYEVYDDVDPATLGKVNQNPMTDRWATVETTAYVDRWTTAKVKNVLKIKASNSCVGCNLSGVNLTNANLTGATLKNARIGTTIFCNTKTPWGLDNSGCRK